MIILCCFGSAKTLKFIFLIGLRLFIGYWRNQQAMIRTLTILFSLKSMYEIREFYSKLSGIKIEDFNEIGLKKRLVFKTTR